MTTWMNLKIITLCQVKVVRCKKLHLVWFRLHRMSRTGKSIVTESALGETGHMEWRGWGLIAKGYKVSLWGDENIQELDSGGSCTLYEYTMIQEIVCFKRVDFIWYVNYVSKLWWEKVKGKNQNKWYVCKKQTKTIFAPLKRSMPKMGLKSHTTIQNENILMIFSQEYHWKQT